MIFNYFQFNVLKLDQSNIFVDCERKLKTLFWRNVVSENMESIPVIDMTHFYTDIFITYFEFYKKKT